VISQENQILDAAQRCRQRWGIAKVTMDDIVAESGVSRATIYRLFPGGKEVLFEALRVRYLEEFFGRLRTEIATTSSLEDLLVAAVVCATRELREDSDLALQLSTEPGETVSELTVAGLPRIIRMANALLVPYVAQYVEAATARTMIDALARLVISLFLAPSDHISFAEDEPARRFIQPLIQTFLGPDHLLSITTETQQHQIQGDLS
jgi:AcrR family transcriptional regulator